MKKPASFTMFALALCAADARAQSDGNQLDLGLSTSTLARRIDQLHGQPGHELAGQGHWMVPSALREGRIDAVIDGAEGEPAYRLDALTTEYLAGTGPSARFVYGGLYGTLYALDGSEAAPILVQGEWARHGNGSPNGSLLALVYRSAAFPQNVEVLGTLTGQIQFFDDGGAGSDGAQTFTITGVQALAGANDAQGLRAAQEPWMPTRPRARTLEVARLGRMVGLQPTSPGQPLLDDAGRARSMSGPAVGSSAAVTHLAQHRSASAPQSAPSDAGLARHIDRVGTCGTQGPGPGVSISGQAMAGQQAVGAGGATTMQVDGHVRLIYRVLD